MRKEGKLPPAEPRKSKMNSTKRKISELDKNIKLGKRYRVRKTNPGKNCTREQLVLNIEDAHNYIRLNFEED